MSAGSSRVGGGVPPIPRTWPSRSISAKTRVRPEKPTLRIAVDEPVVRDAVETLAAALRVQSEQVVAVKVGVVAGEFAKCAELVMGPCHG